MKAGPGGEDLCVLETHRHSLRGQPPFHVGTGEGLWARVCPLRWSFLHA